MQAKYRQRLGKTQSYLVWLLALLVAWWVCWLGRVVAVKDLPFHEGIGQFRMLSLEDLKDPNRRHRCQLICAKSPLASLCLLSFTVLVVISAYRRCLLCSVFLGFSELDWLNIGSGARLGCLL